MPGVNGSRAESPLYAPAVCPIRFKERSAAATGTPPSYWLLLVFLFLLYANLPFVLPVTEILRPAKVVAGAALVMLLAETLLGRRTLCFAWPEGSLLLVFVGVAAVSCLTALWPRQAAESLSDLVKMALVYFFIVNCANTERRLRGVMWTIVIGGLIPAAGTLRNYLLGQLSRRPGLLARNLCQSQRSGLQPGHPGSGGGVSGGRPWCAAAPGAARDLNCLYRRSLCHLLARWAGGLGSGGHALRLAEAKTMGLGCAACRGAPQLWCSAPGTGHGVRTSPDSRAT